MAKYDKEMAERVWKRVQGETVQQEQLRQPEKNLQALILGEWMAASTYLMLSRQMGQKEAEVLKRMFREEQNHAACLKGMYVLTTGQKCVIQTPQLVKEPVEAVLRKCYTAELQSVAEYEARSSDAEYGHVFARMARQEREHCAWVLELIGSLQKNS